MPLPVQRHRNAFHRPGGRIHRMILNMCSLLCAAPPRAASLSWVQPLTDTPPWPLAWLIAADWLTAGVLLEPACHGIQAPPRIVLQPPFPIGPARHLITGLRGKGQCTLVPLGQADPAHLWTDYWRCLAEHRKDTVARCWWIADLRHPHCSAPWFAARAQAEAPTEPAEGWLAAAIAVWAYTTGSAWSDARGEVRRQLRLTEILRVHPDRLWAGTSGRLRHLGIPAQDLRQTKARLAQWLEDGEELRSPRTVAALRQLLRPE